MKTILVTGGTGFLGKVLVQKLQQNNYSIFVIDSKECDLSHPASLPKLLEIKADYVFHLAGRTRLRADQSDPAEYYRGNLDTTRHLLEFCRIRKTPLHFVSAYIYGNQKMGPISEETHPNPGHPYPHSKWLAEEMCRFYHENYSVPLTISRPFNIYGPSQTVDFFIPKTIEQLRSCNKIILRSLLSTRDYIFVEDAAEALIALMEQGKEGSVYNIGTGIVHSCKEVVELLQSLMKLSTPYDLQERHQIEKIPHAQADIRKICTETTWRPKVFLREGLKRCLEGCKEQK